MKGGLWNSLELVNQGKEEVVMTGVVRDEALKALGREERGAAKGLLSAKMRPEGEGDSRWRDVETDSRRWSVSAEDGPWSSGRRVDGAGMGGTTPPSGWRSHEYGAVDSGKTTGWTGRAGGLPGRLEKGGGSRTGNSDTTVREIETLCANLSLNPAERTVINIDVGDKGSMGNVLVGKLANSKFINYGDMQGAVRGI